MPWETAGANGSVNRGLRQPAPCPIGDRGHGQVCRQGGAPGTIPLSVRPPAAESRTGLMGECRRLRHRRNPPRRYTSVVIPSDLAFWSAVLALVIGLLVLVLPKYATYLVAIYLIAAGVMGILSHLIAG